MKQYQIKVANWFEASENLYGIDDIKGNNKTSAKERQSLDY
jgi:hypothetical protein